MLQIEIPSWCLLCASILKQFREPGVGLTIVTAPEIGNTAQDDFNILASLAEFEREMIASRTDESRVGCGSP